jgi:hypothetical protein
MSTYATMIPTIAGAFTLLASAIATNNFRMHVKKNNQ